MYIFAVATHPRTGTDTWHCAKSSKNGELQLTPARGRILGVGPKPEGDEKLQLTPARGRILSNDRQFAANLSVATHPRTGTDTVYSTKSNLHIIRCNSPPHGDGYSDRFSGPGGLIPLQLTPARGRILPILPAITFFHNVATHPRTGTDTQRPCIHAHRPLGCNSPPHGDGYFLFPLHKFLDQCCNSPSHGDGYVSICGFKENLLIMLQLTPAWGRIPIRIG